jgi:heme-degrading monooxygenase HmoA
VYERLGWREMILEVAILNVKTGQESAFEEALREARPLIEAMPGFGGMELRRCVETPNRYVLLAKWRTVEDHTVGFRGSAEYQEWRKRLHHFYDPFPTVEHYQEPIS